MKFVSFFALLLLATPAFAGNMPSSDPPPADAAPEPPFQQCTTIPGCSSEEKVPLTPDTQDRRTRINTACVRLNYMTCTNPESDISFRLRRAAVRLEKETRAWLHLPGPTRLPGTEQADMMPPVWMKNTLNN